MVPRVKLIAVQESMVEYAKETLTTSAKAYLFFKPLFEGADRESFWAVALDSAHRPLATHRVSEGSLTQSLVHPRELFKFALLVNAANIIVAHNHASSGDPIPSKDDQEVTEKLVGCGELMSVPVLDHIVVGAGSFYSFADKGRLHFPVSRTPTANLQ